MKVAKRNLRMEGSYYFRHTPLPTLDYSVNPYFGCEFSCRYCYSVSYFKLRGLAYGWGEYVEAKVYLPSILSKNLNKFEKGAVIGIGTYTDPYQPWEAELKLTRRILTILRRRKDLKVIIETKSPLVLRDLDVLRELKSSVVFSVSSLNERYARYFEPYAPRPISRLRALKYILKNDIEGWIFIAPLMPYINDDKSELDELLKISARIGVRKVYSDVLRFRLGVRENIISVLREYKPSLIPYYRELNRPKIFSRYNEIVNFLENKSKEYGLEYVDIAKKMWDYLK